MAGRSRNVAISATAARDRARGVVWSASVGRRCIVLSVLIGLSTLPSLAHAVGPPGERSKSETARHHVAVYAVEFEGNCGPPIYPSSLAPIITSSAPKNWVLTAVGPPPLVSSEAVLYSVVGSSGETSLPAARVFAEVRKGGELSFKSDNGKNVVLQADVKKVCWEVDQARAVDITEAAEALLVVLRLEDMTAEANPGGELGRQKSISVSLDMTLVDTNSRTVLGSFSDEARQMDLSVTAATRRAAKSLVARGLKSLTSN